MNRYEKFFSKIGFNYLMLELSIIIIQIIILNIITLIIPEINTNINIMTVLGSICNYILPLPVFVYLMNKLESTDIEKHEISSKKFLIYICCAITLMWIGNSIGTIITTSIGMITDTTVINPIHNLIETTGIYLNMFLMCLIAPIFEEYFFRKLLIDRSVKYGAKISIILSATIFALFHGNLSQFFYAFMLGALFSYIYIKTGHIRYTIALHMIVNFFGSVISLIFTNSFDALNSSFSLFDLSIVIIYIIIIFSMLITGLIHMLSNYKSITDLNSTEIPLKMVFLNIGMICFIGFFALKIIQSLGLT